MQTTMLCGKDGDSVNTTDVDENVTIPVPSSSFAIGKHKHTFSSAVTYTVGDLIFLKVERKNLESADDHPAGIFLAGVVLHYTATGPDSSTSGPYAVGPTGV